MTLSGPAGKVHLLSSQFFLIHRVANEPHTQVSKQHKDESAYCAAQIHIVQAYKQTSSLGMCICHLSLSHTHLLTSVWR